LDLSIALPPAGTQKHKFVIKLFYDVVSPNSYLAFEQLLRLEKGEWLNSVEVVLRPFFLGGVMQATDNKPPITVPPKGAYMMHDLQRNSRALGLRLRTPSRFPASTLLAQRTLLALDSSDRSDPTQRRLRAATRRLWQVYWEEDGDITDRQTISAALVASGFSPEEAAALLQKAQGTGQNTLPFRS